MQQLPTVTRTSDRFSSVTGRFYRAVDPAHRGAVLAGSRLPGRYSRVSEPTLYLSSSLEGVGAAMIAHSSSRTMDLEIVELQVEAALVVDLRDPVAVRAMRIDLADARAPWQEAVQKGEMPRSWGVRDQLQERGAAGLIDPSRRRPGLWHLVLFQWNNPNAPRVKVL